MQRRPGFMIKLTESAKKSLDQLCDRHGMKQEAMLGRIAGWLLKQDETMQFLAIGRIPAELQQDVAKLLLVRRKIG
jgi:hypothetical protein